MTKLHGRGGWMCKVSLPSFQLATIKASLALYQKHLSCTLYIHWYLVWYQQWYLDKFKEGSKKVCWLISKAFCSSITALGAKYRVAYYLFRLALLLTGRKCALKDYHNFATQFPGFLFLFSARYFHQSSENRLQFGGFGILIECYKCKDTY